MKDIRVNNEIVIVNDSVTEEEIINEVMESARVETNHDIFVGGLLINKKSKVKKPKSNKK
ncbi:MAG: hypothetical protein QM499_00970 [Flavobacteriaceae bacterium]